MVRSSVRPIVRSFVHSFVQIIFFLTLCCRNSDRSFVRSFDRPSDRSWFVRPFVRSFDRSFVRSFVQIIFFLLLCSRNSDRSFVRSFDRSSFVHSSYPSFIVRSYELFAITIYCYYLPLLLPLLFTVTFYRYYLPLLFTVTIYRYYSPLLFIDHPITPNFNYSSIMLSSPPKTSQTHISVIQTPVTVIFLPVGTSHLVTHPRFLQVEHA
jgi:hypothetical protein